MKRKLVLFSLILLFFVSEIFAQFTLNNGMHVLEVSGTISTFYNYRDLKAGEVNHEKNRFNLRDAAFSFEGRVGKKFGYQLQMDFADLIQNSTGNVDYENPGLMDAFVFVKLSPNLKLNTGYMKVPYSFISLTPFSQSPYWQRAEFIRGEFFSRRDVGILMEANILNQQIEISAGAFNGTGELSLSGDNDPSGQLEYIGRVSYSYPARYRFQMLDTRITPIPFFQLAINGRYSNRNLPKGEAFPVGSLGGYGLKMINGQKSVFGGDFCFHYFGFSLQAEMHLLKGIPNDTNSVLLGPAPVAKTGGYFQSGCEILQLNYFYKPIKTGASIRYENMNVNDLFKGSTARITYGLFYAIRGTGSMIKANFTKILSEDSIDPLKYTSQFRIGWQWQFQ
jgi:hypothetical protein